MSAAKVESEVVDSLAGYVETTSESKTHTEECKLETLLDDTTEKVNRAEQGENL